jgi:hypothetical protein
MDQKEKLAELSAKLDKLKENAPALSADEMEKQLNEIKLEISKMEENKINSKLDHIENSMKGMIDETLGKIIVDDDAEIGVRSPWSNTQGCY